MPQMPFMKDSWLDCKNWKIIRNLSIVSCEGPQPLPFSPWLLWLPRQFLKPLCPLGSHLMTGIRAGLAELRAADEITLTRRSLPSTQVLAERAQLDQSCGYSQDCVPPSCFPPLLSSCLLPREPQSCIRGGPLVFGCGREKEMKSGWSLRGYRALGKHIISLGLSPEFALQCQDPRKLFHQLKQ